MIAQRAPHEQGTEKIIGASTAPDERDRPGSERLAAAVRSAVAEQPVVGLSVAVVRGERLVYAGGFGHADLATGARATPETDYLWFSMTKIATATAAMQLAERGLLDLDAPVERYVPAFRVVRQPSPVTARHLLSHSAGLANPLPIRWVRPATAPPPDQGVFVARLLARHPRLRSTPGTRASYSNLGYLVLGEAIAAAAGRPYRDYLRDEVLRPLGMDHTDFAYDACRAAARATEYQPLPRPLAPLLRAALPRGIVGGRRGRYLAYRPFLLDGAAYGGLVGPAVDAARLVAAHANLGAAGGTRILSARSVAAMREIATPGGPIDVGLGWFRPREARSTLPRYVEHLGGGLGICNVMRLYPDLQLGVVLMANAPGYDLEAILARIAAEVGRGIR